MEEIEIQPIHRKYATCKDLGIEWVDNLGEKIRSSSDLTGLVEKQKNPNFKPSANG